MSPSAVTFMVPPSLRRRAVLLAFALLTVGSCLWVGRGHLTPGRARSPAPTSLPPVVAAPREIPEGATFVIAAAGDIAGRSNAQQVTAGLLARLRATRDLAAILVMGDAQYPRGDYADFVRYYDPTWGRPELKSITRPVPGNHEYLSGDRDAQGYFDYFNGRGRQQGQAGARGQGYYSFDMGDWHFVALNSSDGCKRISCKPGSPMHSWLVDDLRKQRRRCVLAYLHHPRFQQGSQHGDVERVSPLWDALYDAGVDVALAGHEHNFQQLAPLNKRGERDPQRGIRSFVVGTGGAHPYLGFSGARGHLVERRSAERFGVLELELGPGHYGWRFLDAAAPPGAEVLASGKDVCR